MDGAKLLIEGDRKFSQPKKHKTSRYGNDASDLITDPKASSQNIQLHCAWHRSQSSLVPEETERD